MARDSNEITPTHSRTIPAFTPQPQGITALWLHGTHCAYPRRDDQAELTWVTGYILRYIFSTPGVEPRTRSPIPSTNRARRRLASLIETNALTMRYAIHFIVAYIHWRHWRHFCTSSSSTSRLCWRYEDMSLLCHLKFSPSHRGCSTVSLMLPADWVTTTAGKCRKPNLCGLVHRHHCAVCHSWIELLSARTFCSQWSQCAVLASTWTIRSACRLMWPRWRRHASFSWDACVRFTVCLLVTSALVLTRLDYETMTTLYSQVCRTQPLHCCSASSMLLRDWCMVFGRGTTSQKPP